MLFLLSDGSYGSESPLIPGLECEAGTNSAFVVLIVAEPIAGAGAEAPRAGAWIVLRRSPVVDPPLKAQISKTTYYSLKPGTMQNSP